MQIDFVVERTTIEQTGQDGRLFSMYLYKYYSMTSKAYIPVCNRFIDQDLTIKQITLDYIRKGDVTPILKAIAQMASRAGKLLMIRRAMLGRKDLFSKQEINLVEKVGYVWAKMSRALFKHVRVNVATNTLANHISNVDDGIVTFSKWKVTFSRWSIYPEEAGIYYGKHQSTMPKQFKLCEAARQTKRNISQ